MTTKQCTPLHLRTSACSERLRCSCSLISLETHDSSSPPELSAREEEALRRTATCLEACRIGEVLPHPSPTMTPNL